MGTVGWRDDAMDTTTAPIAALTAHLAVRSLGKEGRMAMERFAAAGVDTHGLDCPLELARWCHDLTHVAEAPGVVARLIALAPTDELAALVALVALRPALYRVADRLGRRRGPAPDVEADVVAAAWAALGHVAAHPPRGSAARAVVVTTWTTLRTEHRQAREPRVTPSDQLPEVEDAGGDPALRVPLVLWDARRQGVLSARQARLLHDTRVLDVPVDAVARAGGRSRQAVWKERRRAEMLLRAHLEGTGSTGQDCGAGR